MRLESILKKANKVDLTNSKLVRIFQMKRLKGPGFLAITITREPGQRPRKHLVKIYPRNPDYKGTITNCPNVMIRCDCARNMYKWEVANAVHKCSPIYYSNGAMPYDTNPALRVGACIAKGSKITTNKGLINIEDIKVGNKVWTTSGFKKVEEVSYMGRKKTLVFETISGKVEATYNHKMLVATEKGLIYRRADKLKKDDVLVFDASIKDVDCDYQKINYDYKRLKSDGRGGISQYVINKVPSILDEKLAFILGCYFGDGCKVGNIAGTKKKKGKVLQKLKKYSDYLFDSKSKIFKNGGIKLGKEITSFIKNFCNEGYETKKIPDELFKSPKSVIASFLNGVFSTDGCINRYGISCFTTSKATKKIVLLLSYLGIFSTISERHLKSGKILYFIRIGDRISRLRFFDIVSPTRFLEKYYENLETNMYGWLPDYRHFCPKINNGIFKDYLKEQIYNYWIERLPEVMKVTDFADRTGISRDGLTLLVHKFLDFELRKVEGSCKRVLFAKSKDMLLVKLDNLLNKRFSMRYSKKGMNTNKESLRKFFENMESRKFKISDKYKKLVDTNLVFVKVKNITKSEAPVYDIGVKGNPQFCANGFFVHNCKHSLRVGRAILNHKW